MNKKDLLLVDDVKIVQFKEFDSFRYHAYISEFKDIQQINFSNYRTYVYFKNKDTHYILLYLLQLAQLNNYEIVIFITSYKVFNLIKTIKQLKPNITFTY